ncbi:hypothetical protein KFU94_20685 [Chloroflexi bacterium TSY]|nr:hypothetical protein [Chloroflexi bacterium TSY]
MDFAVGTIERKDQYIIITSDPDRSTIETKVRVSPDDVWDMLKAGLNWPTVSYILSLPFLIRQSKHTEPS